MRKIFLEKSIENKFDKKFEQKFNDYNWIMFFIISKINIKVVEIKNKSLVRMVNGNNLFNAYIVGKNGVIIFSVIWIGILYIFFIKYGIEIVYCDEKVVEVFKDNFDIDKVVVNEVYKKKYSFINDLILSSMKINIEYMQYVKMVLFYSISGVMLIIILEIIFFYYMK